MLGEDHLAMKLISGQRSKEHDTPEMPVQPEPIEVTADALTIAFAKATLDATVENDQEKKQAIQDLTHSSERCVQAPDFRHAPRESVCGLQSSDSSEISLMDKHGCLPWGRRHMVIHLALLRNSSTANHHAGSLGR